MKLGIFIGKEEYKAVIMDVPVKDGVIYSLSSKDLSKVKEFILPYKKNISSAGIFISDYYTEYFINEFKGAKDEDLPKLIKFKVKELSLYKEAVSVLGFQAINKVENLIKTVSAVTKGEIVKQAEELVNDKEKLQERLAKLSGGIAVIKVGGATEIEVKEKFVASFDNAQSDSFVFQHRLEYILNCHSSVLFFSRHGFCRTKLAGELPSPKMLVPA